MSDPMQSRIHFSFPTSDTLLLTLAGSWSLHDGLLTFSETEKAIRSTTEIRKLTFDTQQVTCWDSSLVTFVLRILAYCSSRHIDVDRSHLPEGVQRLLTLATSIPERQDARRTVISESWLARLGRKSMVAMVGGKEMLAFIGEASLAFVSFLKGNARFRRSDFLLILQECGAQALPIVSLISFLVGLILAFVGAVQLQQFGAQIYVANLVGLGMAREMGAMMTGIIMGGRTGASFAAQLGTMRVNQEIDAMVTLGLSPMEFLVLPRMLALSLMMPLLCLYADVLGILGGMVVGVTMLDLGFIEYFNQTQATLSLMDFFLGLVKSVVFGILVAIAGCLRGMQSGNSSAAVGIAATSAVVTSIVFIVVSDSILTVLYDVLGV
ncbi:MAG: ABC transporter permease [Nitrospirales bacterium]|nr:MAG: ABC transporter permease [Nitrospirales bacterium]